jgi:hypothetical protein
MLCLYVCARRCFAPRRAPLQSLEARLHDLRVRGALKVAQRGGDPHTLPRCKPIVDERGAVWQPPEAVAAQRWEEHQLSWDQYTVGDGAFGGPERPP